MQRLFLSFDKELIVLTDLYKYRRHTVHSVGMQQFDDGVIENNIV